VQASQAYSWHRKTCLKKRARMSQRLDKSWVVVTSIENRERDRCVDLFARPDGSYGFEEFRRDAEDAGRWTPVQFFSAMAYVSGAAALQAAEAAVPWLAERLREAPALRDPGPRRTS
jgi:hypothetical protein